MSEHKGVTTTARRVTGVHYPVGGGAAPEPTAVEKSFKIIDSGDVCDVPAWLAGHHSTHPRQPPNPYGIGCQFKIDSLTGITFIFGDTSVGTGYAIAEVRVQASGQLRVEMASSNTSGSRCWLIFPSGTVTPGVWHDLDIRTGGLSVQRRLYQARCNGVYVAGTTASSSGGQAGALNHPVRLGNSTYLASNWGVSMKNYYGVKGSASDAQWDAINAATDRAARLAAIQDIGPDGHLISPTSLTDMTVGIEVAGEGNSDAVCSGMNSNDNLFDV